MKHTADVLAAGAAGGSFIGVITGIVAPVLAAVASLCAIVWYGIRFYEYISANRAGQKPPVS